MQAQLYARRHSNTAGLSLEGTEKVNDSISTMTHIYGIDDSGLEFVSAAARISEEFKECAAEVDRDAVFPQAAITKLGEQGLLGLCVPADFGGKDATPGVFAGVVEQLAQACASTAMIYVMHVTAAQALVASKTLAERKSLLRAIAAGKHLTTLAFSERGSRSQFWAPVSQLREDGHGGFVTSASKSWV
ncbi:MAG: acyl-CoA/acyl-ACP dehydrogenase, partial [Pirellulales bacterium]|nr:acyl-CoA/acyl-ACP dehydrogenase [Pirellulales bacterium]